MYMFEKIQQLYVTHTHIQIKVRMYPVNWIQVHLYPTTVK